MKSNSCRILALILACHTCVFDIKAELPTPDPDDGGLKLPPGFHALVVADKLGGSRFLTVAPNGDVYLRHTNIMVLRDTKGDGHLKPLQSFGVDCGKGQDSTGIAFHGDYLYYSNKNTIYRYKMTPGQPVPTGDPETIVKDLPGSAGHQAKSITFDAEGNMYIDIGSPQNVYSRGDRGLHAKGLDATEFLKTRGGIWRFKSDVPNQTEADGYRFITGERHTIAIAFNPVSKQLFGVMMGRDNLSSVDPADYTAQDNAEDVAEEMHQLKDGANWGWPYTYYNPLTKVRMIAPEYGGDNKKKAEPGKYEDPVVAFPGHWAPLQMTFYTGTQFPEKYRNGAFVAFHGSWNRAPLPQAGYNVAFVPFDSKGMPLGTYEVFADNFAGAPVIYSPGKAKYRPSGVAVGPDGSLYVCSDNGRIWRIIYTGKVTKPSLSLSPVTDSLFGRTPSRQAPVNVSPKVLASGLQVYTANCAACHQVDGSGVPNIQPALTNDDIVTGDPTLLVRAVLQGPASVLPPGRPIYSNKMPPFSRLTDQQIADVLTYIRHDFGHQTSTISARQVQTIRARVAQ
jgi:glucose/arabinose dehydrogenase/mono/diheme cytochrome c family protein